MGFPAPAAPHRHANAHMDAHMDAYAYANRDAHSHSHAYCDADPDAYAYANYYRDLLSKQRSVLL